MLFEDFKIARAETLIGQRMVGVVGERRFRKRAKLGDGRRGALKAAHLLLPADQVVLPRSVGNAVEKIARFFKAVLLQYAANDEADGQTLSRVIQLHQDVAIDGNRRGTHACDSDMSGNGEHDAFPTVAFRDVHHGLITVEVVRNVHVLRRDCGMIVAFVNADGAALVRKNVLAVEEKLISELVHHNDVVIDARAGGDAFDLLEQFGGVGFDGRDEIGFGEESGDEIARITAGGALNIEEQGVGHCLDVVLEQAPVSEASVVGTAGEFEVAQVAVGEVGEFGFGSDGGFGRGLRGAGGEEK